MSLPSSIKLLKLSTSNSHINSRRLSAVVNLASNKLNHEFNKFNKNQTANSTQQTNSASINCDSYKDGQTITDYEFKEFSLVNDKSSSSSSVSSNLFENLSAKSEDCSSSQVNCLISSDSNNQTAMGSSSSKCTKITDQPINSNSAGWVNCRHQNNLPPQINQPYLSCSMINLADCACCHHSFAHPYDATVNNNLLNNLSGKTNNLQYKNCALNHCCSISHSANHLMNANSYQLNNGIQLNHQINREIDSAKEPYWLQQAKKSNRLARKDQKFGLFSRNLLSMGINETVSHHSKFQYHTHVGAGMELLREPNLNKDLAYTHKEREKLGIKGLIPPAVRSQELQARIAIDQFRKLDGSLKKYMYLRDLQDFNKRLFYRILIEYVEELMPIVYTPVVGDACIKYSELYKRPRGLFITKHDIGHVNEILNNWPEKDIKAIVVTDGERILGLGDLGANGMGIPVGKLALYSALASIPPHLTLPVTLDVGTNNEKLINSEYYIGLKEPRERGPVYDKLLDEFMESVVRKWGRTCLIQFEDFGNSNAFKLLQKYRNHYCTFNDDIQGTASVAVAGVIAACKRMKKKISQQKFLFMGAGGAALGISDLLVMAMEADGLTTEQAVNNIFLIDSKGLVSKDRQNETDQHKMTYAKQLPNYQDLEKVVDIVKPSCLIGVCAQPAVFTPKVLSKMAQYNESPLIFPLSNPTSKAECTAEQAYINTDGKCIFASGSPFDIIKYKNQTFIPGQGNNSYIFPGIALAVMSCSVHTIPEETFLVAARALADQVTPEELSEGRIYPSLKKIQQVSVKIATKVAQYFFNQGLSTIRPEPEDKELFVREHQYSYEYDH